MRNLLWFHAFRFDTPDSVLRVLQKGATPPGASGGSLKTRENERVLGLDPKAYAYLGRASEDFGRNGFAVPMNVATGKVSPFDTGGLVEYIKPVAGWEEPDKKRFLDDFSWPHRELMKALNGYPTKLRLGEYLDGDAPEQSGPHQIWKGTEADIWHPDSKNEWRAWTWEVRSDVLPAGQDIVGWTCPSPMHKQIKKIGEQRPRQTDWFAFLLSTYIPGGVSQLIRTFRASQGEAA